MKKFFWVTILVTIFAGCTSYTPLTPSFSKSAIIWEENRATKYYESSPKVAYLAVKRACKESKYTIDKDEIKKDVYHILSNNKLDIFITPTENEMVSVVIKAMTPDDEPYIEAFYKKLDIELETVYFEKGKPAYNDLTNSN